MLCRKTNVLRYTKVLNMDFSIVYQSSRTWIALTVLARVSACADDISMFVSWRSDIEVAQKAFERYEKVTGAKINCDKSS